MSENNFNSTFKFLTEAGRARLFLNGSYQNSNHAFRHAYRAFRHAHREQNNFFILTFDLLEKQAYRRRRIAICPAVNGDLVPFGGGALRKAHLDFARQIWRGHEIHAIQEKNINKKMKRFATETKQKKQHPSWE